MPTISNAKHEGGDGAGGCHQSDFSNQRGEKQNILATSCINNMILI